MKLLLLVLIAAVIGSEAAKEKAIKVKDKDMMRKMIIYDKVYDITEFLEKVRKGNNYYYCPCSR